MIYSEIKAVALAYSMRKDQETVEMMDSFLLMVESKMNRALDTKEMAYRTVLITSEDKGYYGLPDGFISMRDIQVETEISGGEKNTPIYVSPEVMNNAISINSDVLIYTIIANQIQLHPVQDNQLLEIVYRKRIPALTSKEQSNWVSIQTPDAYIFGLLVEISSFAKDAEAAQLWNSRFDEVLNTLQREDDVNRWSGPALRIQLG